MNPSTKDEMAGKVHEVKGTIKEKIGQLTDDPDLEGEGIVEKIGGKIQTKSARQKRPSKSCRSGPALTAEP